MRHLGAMLAAAALGLAACGETGSPSGPGPGKPGTGAPDGGSADGGSPDGGNPGSPQEPQGTARIPAYLKASPYPRLVLEVDATEGFAPRASVESAVLDTLRAVVDKPGGVSVARDQMALPRKGSNHEWTFTELQALAASTYNLAPAADTVRMHVLFLDGQFQSGNVLGLAWSSKHLVVFKETIERHCRTGLGSTLGDQVCRAVEQGVWVHELGHVLGLVNNGLPMAAPHEDAEHAGHDGNDRCVMYWAFDSSASLDKVARQLLGGESVNLDFDEACKADLAAGRTAP